MSIHDSLIVAPSPANASASTDVNKPRASQDPMTPQELQLRREHRETVNRIAARLPDNILKQVLTNHIHQRDIFVLMTKCRALYGIAQISLYTNIVLPDRKQVDKFMQCVPDPTTIAEHVERLEIPGGLTSPAREYIQRLLAHAPHLEILSVGKRDSNDEHTPYLPFLPPTVCLRTLFVGAHSKTPLVPGEDRYVNIDVELQQAAFRNIRQLHWNHVDPRLGTTQSLLERIDEFRPDLQYLQIGWSNNLDTSLLSSASSPSPDLVWALPPFRKLKHITFRFDHHSMINVRAFVFCLRAFYKRGIAVKVNSGCAVESFRWRMDMYTELWRQGNIYENNAVPLLTWAIQNNRHHLLNLTSMNSRLKETMLSAIQHVPFRDVKNLRLQIDLTNAPLSPVLLAGNLYYLRLVVNRTNLNPEYIPSILKANKSLKHLIVVLHVQHQGPQYDGNCTYNKIPLIPGQSRVRNSNGFNGVPQRFTLPTFDLKYNLKRRDSQPSGQPQLSQKYISYPSRIKPGMEAPSLPELNVFGLSSWRPSEWTEQEMDRLNRWENEVKGWFEIGPILRDVSVIINTDPEKFGRVEQYWCVCEKD